MKLRPYLRHPFLCGLATSLRVAERVAPPSARATCRRAVEEIVVAIRHREGTRQARRLLGARAPHRLNIGCGGNIRPGWINVDLNPCADIALDIRQPLPFPDASCSELYSEHTLEHLRYPGEVEIALRDWLRVLIPGGKLSVGVPETAFLLLSYGGRRPRLFRMVPLAALVPAVGGDTARRDQQTTSGKHHLTSAPLISTLTTSRPCPRGSRPSASKTSRRESTIPRAIPRSGVSALSTWWRARHQASTCPGQARRRAAADRRARAGLAAASRVGCSASSRRRRASAAGCSRSR